MPTRALKASSRAVLLAAAVALLAVAVSTALAQSTGEIEIQPADGSEPITVALADVDGSINTSYPIRDAEGNTRRVEITPENGASVDDILKAAGHGSGYAYIEIGDVRLSRFRIRSGDGASGLVPVVYVDEHGTHFLRPLVGRDDENESDIVTVTAGPLSLRQTVDSSLRVKVEASKRKVAAGEKVTFTAEVSGGGVGDRYTFRWRFGDGSKGASRQRVSHEFEEPGRYRVQVAASIPGDISRGEVTVRVGEPEEGGPDREGGGTNTTGGAPWSGAYEGDSGAGGSYGTAPDYSGGTGDGAYDDSYDYTAPDYSPAEPDMALPGAGPTVEGNVLSEIASAPAAGAQDVAARTGDPVDGPVDPAGVPTAAWALGTALALLGAGAGMESGGLRRLRRRPGRPRLPRLPRLLRR